ncbi:MAG: hypothetical protein C4555_03295 [Dehalococcoidia bacterium]|nr:MAG: hypothetical protein C4555_03295 [Dehalococcoidia bacterium]
MKPKMYMGIDIGIDGGIGFIDPHHDLMGVYLMPVIGTRGKGKRAYDIHGVVDLIQMWNDHDIIAIIEDVTFMPTWNKHTLGLQYGCLYAFMGIFATLDIPFQVKQARVWQKKIFEGMPKQDTKTMSALVAKRLYPDESFTVGKGTKIHSGLTDALCIAAYCQYIFGGK